MDLSSFQNSYEFIGTTGFLIFILWKLLEKYVFQSGIDSKVHTLETNHLVHIQADIDNIAKDVRELTREQVAQGNRITSLEARRK